MHTLNHETDYRNSPTLTSSNCDTDDFIMLYTCSVTEINSSCMIGGVNTEFNETGFHVNHTDLCWIPSIVDIIFPFWFCTVAYVPSNIQWSSSSSDISPSPGWIFVMTEFIQNQIDNEEEFKSVHILLKTEWPELEDCVELDWLSYLATQGKSEIHERGSMNWRRQMRWSR